MNVSKTAEKVKNYNPVKVPKFTIHQEVNIEKSKRMIGSGKVFKGEVVIITDRFIVVENMLGIKESFAFVDFQAGMVASI